MSEPVTQDFTACPHWGKGGRYIVDPATGQRVPVVETPDNNAPVDNQVSEPATKKGK